MYNNARHKARLYTADYAEAYRRLGGLVTAGFEVCEVTYLGDAVEYLGCYPGPNGGTGYKLGKVAFLEAEIMMRDNYFEVEGDDGITRKYLPATDGQTEPAWDFLLGDDEMFFPN